MWKEIEYDDTDSINEFISIMQSMDSNYSKDGVRGLHRERIQPLIEKNQFRAFLYRDNKFLIIISFRYKKNLDKYRVCHFGFADAENPNSVVSSKTEITTVLGIFQDKLRDFLTGENKDGYADVPKYMDGLSHINEVYLRCSEKWQLKVINKGHKWRWEFKKDGFKL